MRLQSQRWPSAATAQIIHLGDKGSLKGTEQDDAWFLGLPGTSAKGELCRFLRLQATSGYRLDPAACHSKLLIDNEPSQGCMVETKFKAAGAVLLGKLAARVCSLAPCSELP